jgi:hypothetical protein
VNPLLLEYLKQEIWRAQLHPDNLVIYSESHQEILHMDASMGGYEEIRQHILTTMWNSNGDAGWEQYDRYEDEIKILPGDNADFQVKWDKRFREGAK